MPQPPDALAFIEEIRVAEFWRKQLGEIEYTQRNPDDLYRWYVAMELRGPDEIRAYVEERVGRHPSVPVTGIVSEAPHPTRDIINLWLATHEKVHTRPYWVSVAALLVMCWWILPMLHGCQDLQTPNPPSAWLPQSARLSTGSLTGSPTPLATMPASGPPAPISAAQPGAATIATQNGSTVPRSAPLGAQTGISTLLQSAASSNTSLSSTGSSLPTAGSPQSGLASGARTPSAPSSGQSH